MSFSQKPDYLFPIHDHKKKCIQFVKETNYMPSKYDLPNLKIKENNNPNKNDKLIFNYLNIK